MTAPLVRQTEAAFQDTVIALAKTFRYRVAHFRASRTKDGWRTAVAADGAGFPDLVLVRDRVIFAELKSATGKLSAAQMLWRDSLMATGVEWYCWRPDDWDVIVETLR